LTLLEHFREIFALFGRQLLNSLLRCFLHLLWRGRCGYLLVVLDGFLGGVTFRGITLVVSFHKIFRVRCLLLDLSFFTAAKESLHG
jgi:hypothetical protein